MGTAALLASGLLTAVAGSHIEPAILQYSCGISCVVPTALYSQSEGTVDLVMVTMNFVSGCGSQGIIWVCKSLSTSLTVSRRRPMAEQRGDCSGKVKLGSENNCRK